MMYLVVLSALGSTMDVVRPGRNWSIAPIAALVPRYREVQRGEAQGMDAAKSMGIYTMFLFVVRIETSQRCF